MFASNIKKKRAITARSEKQFAFKVRNGYRTRDNCNSNSN